MTEPLYVPSTNIPSDEEQIDELFSRIDELFSGFQVQQALFFGQPPHDLEGLAVSARCVPSETLAGDFYDFTLVRNRTFDLLLCDVMGKGLPASWLGAAVQSQFLHALNQILLSKDAIELPMPAEIVNHVSTRMGDDLIKFGRFVTLCYARFDLERKRLVFVDGGHTKTIHYRFATGECVELEGVNLPMGVCPSEEYRQETVQFGDGDLFLFYSDGVTEARNPEGEIFGEARLVEFVNRYWFLDPEILIDRISSELRHFVKGDALTDDVTCVVIRVGPDGREKPVVSASLTIESRLENAEIARDFVRRVITDHAPGVFHGEVLCQMDLAMAEGVVNIIKHAYGEDPNREIEIRADIFSDRYSVRLIHGGKSFVREEVPAPSFDGSRSGGFGLFIIETTMDRVDYEEEADGKKCVHMVKNIEKRKERDGD